MMVDNFECAGYTFYSKFDSGNLGKVELVRCCEGLGIVGNTVSSVTGGNASANIAGVPVITTGGSNGGQQSIVPTTNTTSASAIVAATLGVGVALSTTTATTAGSGTLGLPIPSPTPHATENPLVEVEFNLWTRPDCAGTPYENQNRTWFHFAVTGGRPNQIVKFNVMNLNKQAKLFSQGMHPVTKVGPNGRWERIKDKPSYSITNDVFYISFLHKAPEVATDQTKIYYAFTFPFTYTELLDQLATFDRKYGRHPFELNKMAYDISQKYDTSTSSGNSSSGPGGEESKGISNLSHRRKKGRLSKMERVDRTSDPESFDETARDGTAVAGDDDTSGRKPSVAPPTKEVLSEVAKTLQATLGTAGGSMVIDDNTSESMQAITNLVNNVKIELPAGGQKPQPHASSMTTSKLKLPSFHNHLTGGTGTSSTIAPTIDDDSKSDTRDEIYYCRELLTHSVERRRIELLTISSFHGVQTAREVRLRNLFPDEDAQRCHTFRDKKIVFISSRVHPGETPASFVLNGFLSMLLDRKSVISQTLRRMYVFKIIPFLNPDGVYNGLYRSDTRGHNLNRVYIAPCHETQPAIYAARKLIRYYHLSVDEIEPYELEKVEKKSPLPQATVEGSPGLQDAVTSEGTTTTAPVSVEANPPLKKESDSVEQDTPAASDSGFSEASTASSKVVTMSSISSAGSTPPENDGKTAAVGEEGSLVGALSPPQPPSLAVAAATAVAAGAAAGGGGGKVFTDKLIPELNPIVVGETAVRPMGGAGRSASSTSLISSGSLSGAGGGKKSIHSVQAKVDSGKGGSKGGGKQHVALNKPQFIGSTPAGTLKLKEFLLHPHHHHHHHHHHHPHHHHHHHQTVPGAGAVTGSVAGGGSVQGQAVLHGGKMSLGGLKKATAGHKKDGSSSASSSARAPTGSSILGEATPGGGKNLRPQTPQTQPQFSHYRSHRNEYLGSSVGIGAGVGAGTGASQRNLNISLDFLAQLDERNDRVVYEDRSNLFMYIDLHGHASKKGVFMYGNHLPSTVEAVECMLLPRLMSLNSQHFHFDACNFSERNMYYKGKRDGLSKEGSGRVAVYKSTGLIKSYTLECNYNTGKCVNILPPRGKEIVAKTTHTLVPPKYVPAVFEEVGKALGPSILDLTNSNPLSRLPNCEFRTLQGLRNALRIEIERGSSKARVTNKAQKSHSKRHAGQLSSSMMIEISKENQAIQWEHPVGGSGAGGGGVGGSGSVIGAVGSSVAVAVAVGAGGVASGGGGAGNNTVCKVVGDPDPSNPTGHHGSVSMPVSGGVVIGGSVAVAGGSGRQFLKGTSVVTLKAAHGTGGGKISRKGAGGFVKKKQKVLCDVGSVGGLVTTGGGGMAGGKKMQELQVLRSTKEQTVPRKKIKVSPQTIVDRSSGLELCFKGGLGVGSLPNFLTAVPAGLGELPLAGSGAKKVSKSESKLLDMVVVNDLMQCDDSFDAAPCCSYSSTSGAIVTTTSGAISKLISTYTQAENASGSGTGEIPTSLIVGTLGGGGVGGGGGGIPIDTSGTGMLECNAIGGSSSGESSSSLKFGKASLKPKQKTKLAKSTKSSGADTGKKLLKKKRSLKTDTNLKRKKTRVKPALT